MSLTPQSLNLVGQIAGTFVEGSFGTAKGRTLIRDRSGDTTVFDAPFTLEGSSTTTDTLAINNWGDIAGRATDVSQNNRVRGFVRWREGTFLAIDADTSAGSKTVVMALNDLRMAAGSVTIGTTSHGFIRQTGGKITIFDLPNAANTYVQAMNQLGTIVGYYCPVGDPSHSRGFVRQPTRRDHRLRRAGCGLGCAEGH